MSSLRDKSKAPSAKHKAQAQSSKLKAQSTQPFAALNYFNYFTEIEDAFVRRRGKHLFLSPLDWALMETWKEQEIPLHIVLRGIERAFDSYEAKPRKRSVKTLLYCQEEVEAQFAEWVEARIGAENAEASPASNDATQQKTPFSVPAIRDHLQRCRHSLDELAAQRKQPGSDFSEALSRAAGLLQELQNDVVAGPALNTRKLEDSLTGLDRMLNESILRTLDSTQLETITKEVKAKLKPYRSHMEPAVYQQTVNNLLLKRLREQFAVPRLSLFYLEL